MNMVELAAGHDHHLRRARPRRRSACARSARDRLAQRQDADRRRVAVMAVAQRLHRRLDDVVGRAEVGLADAEIDDVAALARQAAVARASTAKAFSSPMRSKAATVVQSCGAHFTVIAFEANVRSTVLASCQY